MNKSLDISIGHSACPHDCPSTCALDVEVIGGNRIGRLRGAKANSYTDGVICAKVARYAERMYHPDRLTKPLCRKGSKGGGDWSEISWALALDEIAEQCLKAEARYGSESVWLHQYAGTMGLVQRDCIHMLRHAKRFAGQFDTICVNPAWDGICRWHWKTEGTGPAARWQSLIAWSFGAPIPSPLKLTS